MAARSLFCFKLLLSLVINNLAEKEWGGQFYVW